jgi:type I restriction enzyme, S subunit
LNIIATSEITPAIRKWKPYPGYKHSGVEWLGMVPEHWNVSTLKLLAPTINRGKSPDYVEEGGIPVINQACIYWEGLRLENVKFDIGKEGGNGRGRLFSGDVLINSTGTGTLGRASVFRQRGTYLADGHVTIVRLDQTAELSEYLFYLFQTPIYQGFVYAALVSGSTNQIELSRESFRATPTIVPPINEQARIVHFLNRETAKIDALVAKKERLIELLQEKRAALITRAVTKGLNPNVPMKDSGVEWLGEIPAHWEVKRLLHLTPSERPIMYGIVLPGPNVDDGVPIVKGGDVSPERLRLDRLSRTTFEIESGYARSRLRGGDLVYAIRGSIGEVASVPGELEGANLTQDAARVAYTRSIYGPWLLYALKSTAVFSQLEAGALGATIKGINIRDLKRALIPVPDRAEQETIGAFLDHETAKIDSLLAKVREGIERLKEYRTALISAAVTGKIDVREDGVA